MIRRSVMTLYSSGKDIYSHQVRLALAEKAVSVDVLNVDENHPCESLAEINPYNSLPTLVDRDLVLFEPRVIMEYLDERFPHPPLLPVYPVARAKSRLMMYRIERDWYSLYHQMMVNDGARSQECAQALLDSVVSLEPVFKQLPYFLSEDYTMVDCCLGPLLWRLLGFGMSFPKKATGLHAYAKRIFTRETFQASLSEVEREMSDVVF